VVVPTIEDEDLVSIELPAFRPRTSAPQGQSTRPPQQRPQPSKRGPKVDELGFFTDFDDDDHPRTVAEASEDVDHEEQMLREAARRGAESLYEPRRQKAAITARSKRAGAPDVTAVLVKLVLGFVGIAAAGAMVYAGVHLISRAGLRSALSGLPYEIQAEFEQDGDTPIGSPAPPAARIDKSLPVRDLSKHRGLLKDIIADFNAMADALAQINDKASADAQLPRVDEISKRLQSLQSRVRTEQIFNPNPKEDQILAKEYGKSMRAAGVRIRDQLRRIQADSQFPLGMSMAISQVDRALGQMESQFIAKGEMPDPDKYAEIRVAGLKSNAEREYVRELIAELATPRSSQKKTASMAATRYAIWPVDSPGALAKKITFGKVIRTSGKEVWVVAEPIDPSILKEREAKKEAAEAERLRMAEESKARAAEAQARAKIASGDIEIPAGADDVTKGLLLATKTTNHFKRIEGLNLLKGADLKARADEVADALDVLTDDSDVFVARAAFGVLQRCDSPKRLEILHRHLAARKHLDETLGIVSSLKDPASAEPLAKALEGSPFDPVKKALIEFGALAESAVIPLLGSNDDGIRKNACEILGEIGSDATLAAMKKLPPDRSPFVRDAASNALRSIQNRKKLSGEPLGKESSSKPYETTGTGKIVISPKARRSSNGSAGSGPQP
jgi:hypothetical protein